MFRCLWGQLACTEVSKYENWPFLNGTYLASRTILTALFGRRRPRSGSSPSNPAPLLLILLQSPEVSYVLYMRQFLNAVALIRLFSGIAASQPLNRAWHDGSSPTAGLLHS